MVLEELSAKSRDGPLRDDVKLSSNNLSPMRCIAATPSPTVFPGDSDADTVADL